MKQRPLRLDEIQLSRRHFFQLLLLLENVNLMVSAAIEIPEEKIAEFCQRNHITKMALFGSVLRDGFTPKSDVDVLVEFHPEHIPGWAFYGMQDELGTIFQREVDLLTFTGISKYFRKKILREAQTVYVMSP